MATITNRAVLAVCDKFTGGKYADGNEQEKARHAAGVELLKLLTPDKSGRTLATIDDVMAGQAEIAPKAAVKALYAKVAEKGGISLYGLQRMPVTLYVEQWERVEAFLAGAEWAQFKADNTAKFSRKAR